MRSLIKYVSSSADPIIERMYPNAGMSVVGNKFRSKDEEILEICYKTCEAMKDMWWFIQYG